MNANTFLGGRIKEYIPPYRTQPGTRWLRPNGPGDGLPHPEIDYVRHLRAIGAQFVMADENGVGAALEERTTVLGCSGICNGCQRNVRARGEVPDPGNERSRRTAVRFEVHNHHVGPLCPCRTEKADKRAFTPFGIADPDEPGRRGVRVHGPAHQARGMNMVIDEHK